MVSFSVFVKCHKWKIHFPRRRRKAPHTHTHTRARARFPPVVFKHLLAGKQCHKLTYKVEKSLRQREQTNVCPTLLDSKQLLFFSLSLFALSFVLISAQANKNQVFFKGQIIIYPSKLQVENGFILGFPVILMNIVVLLYHSIIVILNTVNSRFYKRLWKPMFFAMRVLGVAGSRLHGAGFFFFF